MPARAISQTHARATNTAYFISGRKPFYRSGRSLNSCSAAWTIAIDQKPTVSVRPSKLLHSCDMLLLRPHRTLARSFLAGLNSLSPVTSEAEKLPFLDLLTYRSLP